MKSYIENPTPTMSQFLCWAIVSALRNLGGQKAVFMQVQAAVYNLFLPSWRPNFFFFLLTFSSAWTPLSTVQRASLFSIYSFPSLWVPLFYLNIWRVFSLAGDPVLHVFSFNMLKMFSHWILPFVILWQSHMAIQIFIPLVIFL